MKLNSIRFIHKLKTITLIILYVSVGQIGISQKLGSKDKNLFSIERLFRENNQMALKTAMNDWDSCTFVQIGQGWNKKHGLIGYGYSKGYISTLEVFFIKNETSDDYWAIQVDKIKSKKIRDFNKIENLQKFNSQQLFELNEDSLKLKTRTGTYIESSHTPYSVLIAIKEENFKIIHLDDAAYYQSMAPTVERRFFLKEINSLLRILKN